MLRSAHKKQLATGCGYRLRRPLKTLPFYRPSHAASSAAHSCRARASSAGLGPVPR